MDYIALSGPPCSGKTAVGRELERRGYLFIDFCDLIKQIAADVLSHAGVPTTVEMVRANKDRYRQFLQVLGDQIGFNNDPKYVYRALWNYGFAGCAGRYAVFDNVRTPEQFAVLNLLGFKLVRLDATLPTRWKRAESKYGVSLSDFIAQESHPIEKGEGLEKDISLQLDATQPVERLVESLMTIGVTEGSGGTPTCVSR